MNLMQLTTTIQRLGLAISFTPDGKIAAGPKPKLTLAIRQAIAEHKNELRKLFPPATPAEPEPDRREQIRAMLDRVAAAWPEGYELEADGDKWDEAAKAIDEALRSSDDRQFARSLEQYETTAGNLFERFCIMNEAGDTSFDTELIERLERLERTARRIKNECKRKGLPTIDDADFRFVGLLERWRT
jgi:hypothetical protein